MFEITLRKLTIWRNKTARSEGVELFRVLSNKTLEEIAQKLPTNKAEMIEIKGIKEAKFSKYGKEILAIIKEENGSIAEMSKNKEDLLYFKKLRSEEKNTAEEKVLSVGEFWDIVNGKLTDFQAKIRGEISSVDIRNSAVYFSLKDKKDESVMNCFIFRYQYDLLGVRLEEGMEVVVEGYLEVYKPYGRLSLHTASIEPEGEGVLKKEYEALKKKLEKEGLFALENKRKIAGLPQKIGLITSREGAAIGDFMSNIGQFGLLIKFIDSRVEGRKSIFELIDAIKTFSRTDIDILVIIRGGGSLESLQAFNNETLIREIRKIKVPIVCGVGHDRDISLLSLAADYSVSTPTAAARLIGGLWETEIAKLDHFEKNIFAGMELLLERTNHKLKNFTEEIEEHFERILADTNQIFDIFFGKYCEAIETQKDKNARRLEEYCNKIIYKFAIACGDIENIISHSEQIMKLNDPARQLRMGYGIVSKKSVGIRSISQIKAGDLIKIRFLDGETDSEVKKIKKFKI